MDRYSNQTADRRGTSIALPIPVRAGGLFSHRATGDVLALLADAPDTAFGIRDLARATGYAHKSVSDAVEDLEAAGLVEVDHQGRKKLVRIDRDRLTNPDDPILRIPQAEFHPPVRALVERLRETLDDLRGIVLFGSVARGEADRRSDVDCFVLVGGTQATAQQRAHGITGDLNEERFEGDRYRFQVLVESVESARQHGERLREMFAEGLTLHETPALRDLKREVLTDGR